VTSETLLDRMLDPHIKLGTSTPKADPSGDYAFEVFRKAEAVQPGARPVLEGKALQLTGGAASVAPPAGRNAYGWHLAEGRADMFLAYCTAARDAQKENPGLHGRCFARRLPVRPVHPVDGGTAHPCKIRILGAGPDRIEQTCQNPTPNRCPH
jgi:ABC-type molybdate transport system substrate-binding protein